MAAVALGTAWLGGPALALVWLLAGVALTVEWIAMTRVGPRLRLTGLALAALAGLALALILGRPVLAAVVTAASVLGVTLVAYGARDRGWTLLGITYAAAAALVPIALSQHGSGGAAALFWMFAVVWTTDVAAYFTGRALGGPKLWPTVSPRKTWSGFAGGLLGGTLAGTLVAYGAARGGIALPVPLPAIALLSAVASVASQAGDLAESAMKRQFGVKDSGRLIPGHGGFMDRLDGFAAVACLVALVLGGARLVGVAGAP